MKIEVSKLIQWLIVLTTVCGSVYVYAQTITSHDEKIKVLTSRIEKAEDKQESLRNLVINIDKKLERVLTLLGDRE